MIKLAIILGLLGTTQAFAAPVFRVVKKSGPIFVKGPLETRWSPLKGEFLEMGTLLRTDLGARIDLILQKDRVHKDQKSHSLSVKEALITRIDEDLVRRTELNDYPMRDVWDTGPESKKATEENPIMSFAASYVRGLITLQKAPDLPPVEPIAEEGGVQAGRDIADIPILSPSPNALFFLNEGKVRVPLIWQNVGENLNYRISVWEESQGKHGVLAAQSQSWYQLSFEKTGRYFIQIEDSKRRFRSKRLAINIDRPLERKINIAKGKTNPALDLIYPPPHSVQVGSKQKIAFSWTDRDGLGNNEDYRLVIVDKDKPKRIVTKKSSLLLALAPGSYRWFIEKRDGKKAKQTTVSESRDLEVKASADLSKLIQTASGGKAILIDLSP